MKETTDESIRSTEVDNMEIKLNENIEIYNKPGSSLIIKGDLTISLI